MNVWMAHYLPPISFGGCEDLTLTLAKRYGGLLYCPRPSSSKRPGFLSGAPTYKGIYQRRGISGDRVLFQDNIAKLKGTKVDTVFVMGLYWPEVMLKGLRSIGPAGRVVLVPQYHIGDGSSRLRTARNLGIGAMVDVVLAYTRKEADFVVKHLGCARSKVVLAPHLAGICVGNEVYATPDGIPNVPEKLAQFRARKGFALFPSRASKGLDRAKAISARLGLPLVGNKTYCADKGLAACVDFDREDPYAGARVMISLTRNDSYNIGIAKAIWAGVPSMIDGTNEQIGPIWGEFKTVINANARVMFSTLQAAAEFAAADKERLADRIHESVTKVDSLIG